MERKNRQDHGREQGFTLIELMIVIVILSLLAAIVVPNMLHTADDANVAAAKTQIRAFETALVAYKLKFKAFPATNEGLQALVSNPAANYLSSDRIPQDPWGNEYVYTSPGTAGHPYEIICYGEDGQPGGTDYAADIESWDLQGDQRK